jgi:hypothetical protein
VFLHHVVIVEKPLAGGADVCGPVGGGGEPSVGVVEDDPGGVEPREEGRASAATGAGQPLAGGKLPGALGEVLGSEQLAADRAGDEVLTGGGAPAGPSEDPGQFQRGDGRASRGTRARACRLAAV